MANIEGRDGVHNEKGQIIDPSLAHDMAKAEKPGRDDAPRIKRDAVMKVQGPEAYAEEGQANSRLTAALRKLVPAQFSEIIFRLDVGPDLPDPNAVTQAEQAESLVRLMREQKRLEDLEDAIIHVAPRIFETI